MRMPGFVFLVLLFFFLGFSGIALCAPPVVADGGVVNAADYSANFAPGMIVSIFGSGFAAGVNGATTLPLPISLGGASVEVVDGSRVLNAPLFFVSAAQINAQLPADLASSSVQVRVRTSQGTSNSQAIAVAPRCPRLFTQTMDGSGLAVALHADYTAVTPDSPAVPGEYLVLYLTGLGAVSPAAQAGQAGGDGSAGHPLNQVIPPVTVHVNSQTVTAVFAGLAPGYAGLNQINFQVPDTTVAGVTALTIEVEQQKSQDSVNFTTGVRWETAGSAVLDVPGGKVQGGQVTLTVPAGALAGPSQLTILRAGAGKARGSGQVTESYQIKGLPAGAVPGVQVTFDSPSIDPYRGGAYLVMQGPEDDAAEEYVKAQVQGTRLWANLDLAAGSAAQYKSLPREASASTSPLAWIVAGFLSVKEMDSANKHFHIYYVSYNSQDDANASAAADGLESAWTALKDTGFDGDVLRKDSGRVPVSMYSFELDDQPPESWGEVRRSVSGNLTLRLNTYNLIPKAMKTLYAHTLCHLLQRQYANDTLNNYRRWNYQWLWMDEAVATWFERIIGKTQYAPVDYVPLPLQSYSTLYPKPWLFPFDSSGLDFPASQGKEDAPRAHGYGAAMFIEHLDKAYATSDKFDPHWPGQVYSQGRGVMGPLATLLALYHDDQMAKYWTDFCARYSTGKVFAASPTLAFDASVIQAVETAGKAYSIDAAIKSQHRDWTWMSSPFSARAFKIVVPSVSQALKVNWPSGAMLVLKSSATQKPAVTPWPAPAMSVDVVADLRKIKGTWMGTEKPDTIGAGVGTQEMDIDLYGFDSSGGTLLAMVPHRTKDLAAGWFSADVAYATDWVGKLNQFTLIFTPPWTCTQSGKPAGGFDSLSTIRNYQGTQRIAITWGPVANSTDLTFNGSGSLGTTQMSFTGTVYLGMDSQFLKTSQLSIIQGDHQTKLSFSGIHASASPGSLFFSASGSEIQANHGLLIPEATYNTISATPQTACVPDYTKNLDDFPLKWMFMTQ